jgi:hypothetical protein
MKEGCVVCLVKQMNYGHWVMYIRYEAHQYKNTDSPITCNIKPLGLYTSKPFWSGSLLQPFWLQVGVLVSTREAICQDWVQVYPLPLWIGVSLHHLHISTVKLLSSILFISKLELREKQGFVTSLVLPINRVRSTYEGYFLVLGCMKHY